MIEEWGKRWKLVFKLVLCEMVDPFFVFLFYTAFLFFRSEFIRRYLVEIIIAISEFARTSGLVDGSCARPSLLHSRESIGVKYRLIN